MKTQMVALAVLGLLSVFLVAPASAAVTPIIPVTWQGFTFFGNDPSFGTIYGFKSGSSATFSLFISNSNPDYINVTSARISFDWNGNYTGSYTIASPLRINGAGASGATILPVTITFTVPSISVASNLRVHNYNWNITYVSSRTPGNYIPIRGDQGDALAPFAVLSNDQADALAALQQLPSFASCASFRTAEGNVLCQQSQQLQTLAANLYRAADFADAKTNYQTALADWNNALSADKSTGGSLELAGTVQGWGFLLLGIGALVAGVGGILYAWKRPRELRGMTTTPAH